MIKVLHTSDWHIGQSFYGYERSDEQRDMLRQIADIARKEQPDAIVVCGDIYHTATPSATAVSVYIDGMLQIRRQCPSATIIVISGNHDSAVRMRSDSPLWQCADVHVCGGVARNADGTADFDSTFIPIGSPAKAYVAAVPYCFGSNFPPVGDETLPPAERQAAYFEALAAHARTLGDLPRVLLAHLAVSGSDTTGQEQRNFDYEMVPVEELGSAWDYIALGHIHHPQTIGKARYCGTPIAVSFDEQCEHSVSIVEVERGARPRITTRPIRNLRPVRTLPPSEPVAFDKMLDLLDHFDSDEPAYLRANVLISGPVPASAYERAVQKLAGKNARFCTFKWTRETTDDIADTDTPDLTIEEFATTDPIEIARLHYKRLFQQDISPAEIDMLRQAIDRAAPQNP